LVFSEIRAGVDSDNATAVRPEGGRDGMRPLWAAVAVAFVYFAGVKIGLALTFAPSPISVLWPPNALLLAALILAPFRWWGLLLLGAFPAHLVAELQGGVPTPMVLGWFASNASEALLGAAFFRVAGGKADLATVRDVAVVCATAVFAPFVSSFLDAAIVHSLGWRDTAYWTLWRDRFASNTIAALIFVPVVLTWASSAGKFDATPRRRLEGAVLLSGLLAVSVVAFDFGWVDVAPASVLYLPVPFLIWAALRFGLPTISVSLAIVTFLIIWGAGHGKGPFVQSVDHESALPIQLFIVSLAVPLLLLAALIQERRAAELKLRASEGLRSSAFQASPDAIAISRESDNTILQANDRWLELFGYDGDQRDRDGRISSVFSRLDAGQGAGPIESHAEHRDIRDVEVALRDRRGELRHVLVSMVTIENQGERCAMNIVRDITGQRRTEIEEREQRQQLTHLTRVASLSDLSSTLAHELNQPLTAILSNAQAALRLLAFETPRLSELRTILLEIVAADKRAGMLIHHLRLLMKKGEGEFVSIEANHLVSDVLRLMHGEFVTRNIDVAVSLAPDLPPIFGDRVQIEQVLLNLVANAYEAMEAQEGGRHKSLSVATAHEHDGTVQIVVTDSGPGIPIDPPDKIFEPFFTTKGDGLGLGLSICRKIARAHGGSLTAENTEAGGARLRLTLVAAEALLRHERGGVWREAAELTGR